MDPETLMIVCGVSFLAGGFATYMLWDDVIAPVLTATWFESLVILWGAGTSALLAFWLLNTL